MTATETDRPAVAVIPPPPARRRWARVWLVLFPLMAFVTGLVILAGVSTAPYSVLAPGGAYDTGPLVKVVGAPSYKHPGKVLFVTVSVYNQPNYLQVLYGWIHPAEDVFPRQDITEGRSVADDNRFNEVLMDLSQSSATYQALRELGYPVRVAGVGALLEDVVQGSPAYGRLKAGDVVTGINGFSINSAEDLRLFLSQRKPGEHAVVVVKRLGTAQELHVPLVLGTKQVGGKTIAFLGVSMETMPNYRLPLRAQFDIGQVGGPSAGLAFTVGIIDELSKKGVTKGNAVAMTGTMEVDGSVGDVGGVAQKTVAVRDSGADYFLVPKDEYKDAKAHAGSHLKVYPVTSLDDALRVLRSLPPKTASR